MNAVSCFEDDLGKDSGKDIAAMRELPCAVAIACPFRVRDGENLVGFTIPTYQQR